MLLSEIVRRVIELARLMAQGPGVSAERELRQFLRSLPPAAIYMVTTIMYLGRGDFGAIGLLEHYEDMSDTFHNPELAVGQMLDKTPLADYLEEGLRCLSEGGVDVDTLLTSYSEVPLASDQSGEPVQLTIGPWYCDACGQIIERAEDGMLQWLTRYVDHRRLGRDLRIVHHLPASPRGARPVCYPDEDHETMVDDSSLSDCHLDSVLEPDGLVQLLAMVEDGELPAPEVNRMIMRLFVPGYERARPYFQKALSTGLVAAAMPNDYFSQGQLREIIDNIPRLEQRK